MSQNNDEVLFQVQQFVQQQLASNDPSHDWEHVQRVRKTALLIAQEENITDTGNLELIELAALLHDVKDWKYLKHDSNAISVVDFLVKCGYSVDRAEKVDSIVNNIGFKTELEGVAISSALLPLLAVVSDADRLDAIGAIGIARCFTFGGARNRKICDSSCSSFSSCASSTLTAEAYVKASTDQKACTLQHFEDKLLKLVNMMKTNSGRNKATKRHAFMVLFLEQFEMEMRG